MWGQNCSFHLSVSFIHSFIHSFVRSFVLLLPGEIFELKAELNNEKKEKRKEAVKKVIAAMTVGKDVRYDLFYPLTFLWSGQKNQVQGQSHFLLCVMQLVLEIDLCCSPAEVSRRLVCLVASQHFQ